MLQTTPMGRAAKRKAGPELQGLPVRLAQRMAELGWSDGELGRQTGMVRSVVTRIRNGDAVDGLTCETAIRIASAMGVTLDWLLRGTEASNGGRGGSVSAPTVGGGLGNVPDIVEPTEDRRILEAVQRALKTLGVEPPQDTRHAAHPPARAPQARPKRST